MFCNKFPKVPLLRWDGCCGHCHCHCSDGYLQVSARTRISVPAASLACIQGRSNPRVWQKFAAFCGNCQWWHFTRCLPTCSVDLFRPTLKLDICHFYRTSSWNILHFTKYLHVPLDFKSIHTGCFFHWYPPKKLKNGKPRLGESTLTWIVLD